jgi:DNA primase
MLNITEEIKQHIIESNDIVDIIEEFLPLKKNGTNYKTNCPFHNEKTPSFVVSRDKQIYTCFGCGKNGNVISFLMEYKNLPYIEAVEQLARRANINLEYTETDKKTIEKNKLLNRLYEINTEAARHFYKNLSSNETSLKYLKKRNIDINIIKKFGIGYTVNQWDNLLTYLKQKGYKEEEIVKTGLIIKREKQDGYYDRFRNRIMFPIFDIKKRIIGFGGRVLDDSLPKYLNSPDSLVFNKGYNLYGLNIAKEYVKDKNFYLVEGYMDVIKMHSHGFDTAVAALGTSLTDNQIKLLKRYSNKFYICFDSDKAGLKASLRALNMFKKSNLDAKVIIIKDAKDPDEFLGKFGKMRFEMLSEEALDYYDFLEFYYKEEFDLSNKISYINNLFDNLSNVKSDIEKELIIEKMSFKVGVSKESLTNEFRRKYEKKSANTSNIGNKTIKAFNIEKPKIRVSHEEELLKLILKENKLALLLNQIVCDEDFGEYIYIEFFERLHQLVLNGGQIIKENLCELIQEYNELRSDKIEFIMDNIFTDVDLDENSVMIVFKDCFKLFKIKYLELLRVDRNKEMSIINDEVMQREIMNDSIRIAKKIKSLKEEVN